MRNNSNLLKIIIPAVLVVSLLLNAPFVYAQVKIKFIVVNPSPTEKRLIPISFPLPKELKKENVIDPGSLKIRYDVVDGVYLAEGEVELEPKATQVFQIVVENVWNISEDKLDMVQKQTDASFDALKDTTYYETGKGLKDDITRRITEIREDQAVTEPIEERVNSFQVNSQKLKTIENDTMVLEGLVGEAESGIQQSNVTIKVQLKNPSSTEKIEQPVKYYLPPEVNIVDVLDNADFAVRFDPKKSQVYLERNIAFEPSETKDFQIKVKNVWNIKQIELDLIKKETEKVTAQLVGTNAEGIATMYESQVKQIIDAIKADQEKEQTLQDRISTYRENLNKRETARQYLERLKSIMLQFEVARGGEAGEKQKIHKQDVTFGGGKAEGKGGGVGKGLGTALGAARGQTSQQQGGGMKAIRGLKGLIIISESIFRGWKPELVTTWIIILTIMGFTGILSVLFYVIWMAKAGKDKTKVSLIK